MTLGKMIGILIGCLACAATKMKSNIVSMYVVPVKITCNQLKKELKTPYLWVRES